MGRRAATFGFAIDSAARRRLPRIMLAALAMGGLLWLTAHFMLPQGETIHGFAQALALLALIAGGIAIYGLLLTFFGVTGWRETLNAVRRPSRSDLRA